MQMTCGGDHGGDHIFSWESWSNCSIFKTFAVKSAKNFRLRRAKAARYARRGNLTTLSVTITPVGPEGGVAVPGVEAHIAVRCMESGRHQAAHVALCGRLPSLEGGAHVRPSYPCLPGMFPNDDDGACGAQSMPSHRVGRTSE